MYKTYLTHKVAQPVKIDADWNKAVWRNIEPVALNNYMGDKPSHFPHTQVKLAWDQDNIYVIFRVEDRFVRAVANEYNGNVWQDSCVEFFFSPQNSVENGYFNLETNCIATILMRHQSSGMQNIVWFTNDELKQINIAASLPKGRQISNEIQEPTVWTLEYAIPLKILTKYSQLNKPAQGVKWRANFYKCADKTSQPHWLTWSKVLFETPNFHLPKYFGYIEFVE
ncbi:MAG: carbohydrate-binding family 9-like protein [Phycisphaerae bacterium]|nr:carbohydrate-binding family 9-like protein [Phycisphaerae bacterium]